MPPLPPVKAFISHSTKNKKIAMAFRTVLKKYGIIAFVSGRDIKGGQPWQKTIRKEIDNMDIFIAIHTQAFSKSLWCQQETGMALKRENEIEIIPINVGMRNAPESFLTNFQYIKTRAKSTEEVVREFFETLKESEKTSKLYFQRIEPRVKQVDKDAKEAIDEAQAQAKSINSMKNKIDKRLPSATATSLGLASDLDPNSAVGAATASLAINSALYPDSAARAAAASLAINSALYPDSAVAATAASLAINSALYPDSTVAVATGDLVSNHGNAVTTGDLVSRHASVHGSAYRKKANQPRLPVTYPDELL